MDRTKREGTVLTHATLQQSTMQQREKDKDKYFDKKVLLRNNDTHKDKDKERGDCANSCHTTTKYYAAEGKRQRQILRQESITQKQRHTQRQGQRERGLC